ncbi:hypothetical protein PCK2_000517 [Pneumocystis canis]|nr:hypothetical protein PCK2_000517 [Pneumocystis canis]
MEKATVVALSTASWNLEALLRNPVRFGPRFVEPQRHWETVYTPINTFDSSDDIPAETSVVKIKDPSESSPGISACSGQLIARPSIVLFPSDQLLHGWTCVRPSAPGLINVGNTCYLNSVLQVLSHVPSFVQYLLSGHHSSQCQMNACVFCRMEEHISKCYPVDGARPVNAFKPLGIVSALKWISKRFQPYRQEDAHEFLRCLLGEMQRSCIDAYKHLDFASQETTQAVKSEFNAISEKLNETQKIAENYKYQISNLQAQLSQFECKLHEYEEEIAQKNWEIEQQNMSIKSLTYEVNFYPH